MFKSFAGAVGIAVASAVLLAGCGGGGGSGGASGGAPAPTNVQGFAATGAAIAGGAVFLKCVSGAVLTTSTAADGTFTLSPNAAQLPCVLQVTSGPTTLYSFVDGFGRVNVTQLTDLVLARAAGDTPANVYAGFSTALATAVRAGLAGAKAYVSAQINGLDLNPVNIDPLTGTFVVGDTHDVILDQIQAALVTNAKSLDDLRTAARTGVALTTVVPVGELVISEVASGYYYNVPYWFEIANVGATPVNLSGFTVKTAEAVLNVPPYIVSGPTTFSLPDVTVAPGGFLVVRGQSVAALPNTSQVVHISNSMVVGGATVTQVPYWETGGSIELLKNGQTRGFVRFGANSDPSTSYAVSYTAPALPDTDTTYGNSIVRPGNTAALMNTGVNAIWSSVAWTTPAGPNDVPAGATDSDGDGIPDSAEVSGARFAGIDLYAMGARTGVRDILIEVDYMASSDPGVTPQKQALDNVKAAFASQGVNMFIDAGGLFGDAANSGYNWGGGQSVPSSACVYLGPKAGCTGDLYKYKAQYFDVRRSAIFHYALFAVSQESSGVGGSSGVAELPGNDFLVTLGGWSLNTNTTASANRLVNFQAGTFMHELGHNLGLRHGGNENLNYKPNYFSVMNYLYQLNGLSSSAAGLGPYQRWKCDQGQGCAFTESAGTSNSMAISFSNGSGADLVESALLESANIGRGANAGVYADWNFSGGLDVGSIQRDLNKDGVIGTLRDYNDWANIVWPFARTHEGAFGTRQAASNAPTRAFDAMTDDRQPFVGETLRAPAN
jgi:hypothetical protein